MAYLDDWANVTPDDQRKFQQQCEVCLHFRYLHGKVRDVRLYGLHVIDYEAGNCTKCVCAEFRADPLITKDDVLDVAERLIGDVHLNDFGLELSCPAIITRWVGVTATVLHCTLTGGHAGDHST